MRRTSKADQPAVTDEDTDESRQEIEELEERTQLPTNLGSVLSFCQNYSGLTGEVRGGVEDYLEVF
ncbi:hypothetical protein EXE41_10070 [Halorubrum sp. SD690R]|uniref:hypothetical protein n=1 Tax=Halorubrum sp. SD690R TaxID=2518117 RepID=UPI001134EF4C|nr:hypothetical protein [Halorubrum sp. SD690R]TKX46347.1 hypothetical protein EXE41_10070 [Halorubrum sp. SD690R]